MSNTNNIGGLVRKLETDYQSGTTTISKYVEFDLMNNLDKIDAYANSKHTSGEQDALGRDKPFFDIVTSAINIWYRATDIDRKDIKIRPDMLKDTTKAMVASIYLREWMRKERFGTFLNQWGRTLAKYGSSVVKFVEQDGELHAMVVDWNTLIIDTIDFDSNPVIEVLEYTPAQLRQKEGYDQELVERLIEATEAREDRDGQDKDDKADYIKVYEVHGNLSKAFLTDEEEDENIYVQQMQVMSFVESKQKGKFDDFILASGKEKKSPYMITHLIKEEGRSLAKGAVEHLFEAQWMQNHTAKQIKDHLDLASKLIFQTADDNFVGQNAINAIETGDILIHAENKPLTQMNNSSHDIGSLQSQGQGWKALGNEIVGISEAMLGAVPKSGTAWRQTEAVLQESHDLFELMTENKGLHIEDMMREFVLPNIKKTLKHSDEIISTLEAYEIAQIDAKHIKVETEKRVKQDVKESLLKGELPLDLDVEQTEQGIQSELAELGNVRSFVPSEITDQEWDKYFENLEWDVEVDVTGEGKDSQSVLTTLTTVLQTLGSNPQILQSPEGKLVFGKILNMTDAVSPAELSQVTAQTPVALPTEAPSTELPVAGLTNEEE